MPSELEILEMIALIMKTNNLGKINSMERLNTGFNRVVYNINNEYIIKICINSEKEIGIKNEASYFEIEQSYFHPQLLRSDFTKKDIPFIYTIEEKITGKNLFEVWGILDNLEREQCLFELLQILKTIHKRIDMISLNKMSAYLKYDSYLDKITELDILPKDKIHYLSLLRDSMQCYFDDAQFGYIHGDIHFNNIIYTPQGLSLVDFECYQIAPLDKEFDSLIRMIRNPNNFIKDGIQHPVDSNDYVDIIDFFRINYPEVCSQDNFDNRMIIYDCINSLKWVAVYPEHHIYQDVLFERSKKLIK